MRPIVVFTDGSIRREAVELLSPTCDVRVLSAYPSEHTLMEACRDAHAILARLGTVTRRVIEASRGTVWAWTRSTWRPRPSVA
jgi:hypothetical protein